MYLEIPKESYKKDNFFYQKGLIIRDGGSTLKEVYIQT